MANKVIQLSIGGIGLTKLTLPTRDKAGMDSLIADCKEYGRVLIQSGDSSLEWYVQPKRKYGQWPKEDHLEHFIRMVEANLNGTCEFDRLDGERLTREEWIACLIDATRGK